MTRGRPPLPLDAAAAVAGSLALLAAAPSLFEPGAVAVLIALTTLRGSSLPAMVGPFRWNALWIGTLPIMAVTLPAMAWSAAAFSTSRSHADTGLLSVAAGVLIEDVFVFGFLLMRCMEANHDRGHAIPLILAASSFAILHAPTLGLVEGGLRFFPAIVLGVLRLRTGALWAGVMLHLSWNLMAIHLGAVS